MPSFLVLRIYHLLGSSVYITNPEAHSIFRCSEFLLGPFYRSTIDWIIGHVIGPNLQPLCPPWDRAGSKFQSCKWVIGLSSKGSPILETIQGPTMHHLISTNSDKFPGAMIKNKDIPYHLGNSKGLEPPSRNQRQRPAKFFILHRSGYITEQSTKKYTIFWGFSEKCSLISYSITPVTSHFTFWLKRDTLAAPTFQAHL